MTGSIIVRGVPVAVPFFIRTWHETGLFFTCRMRTEPTRAVVNHWTAAENGPDRMVANMRSCVDEETGRPAPKSVHFAVDPIGVVYQLCDTQARCGHARAHGANSWSIGIEFICRGSNFTTSLRGTKRHRVADMIHGRLLAYDDLTAPQIAAGVALNEALCAVYGLPMQVPERDGLVYSTECPEAYLERFRGCLGHLHLEAKKPDPGLTLLRAIRARGQQLNPSPTPGGIA